MVFRSFKQPERGLCIIMGVEKILLAPSTLLQVPVPVSVTVLGVQVPVPVLWVQVPVQPVRYNKTANLKNNSKFTRPNCSTADLVLFGRKLLSSRHPVRELLVQAIATPRHVDGDGGERDAAHQTTQDVHRDQVLLPDATSERFLQPSRRRPSVHAAVTTATRLRFDAGTEALFKSSQVAFNEPVSVIT